MAKTSKKITDAYKNISNDIATGNDQNNSDMKNLIEKHTKQKYLDSKEIQKAVKKPPYNGPDRDYSLADMAYNRVNHYDDILRNANRPRFFLFKDIGKYECVGDNYDYTGEIIWDPRKETRDRQQLDPSREIVVGHCKNGKEDSEKIKSEIVDIINGKKKPTYKGTTNQTNGGTIVNMDITNVLDDEINTKNNKQIILTGAPGTGKTFSVKKWVEKEINNDEARFGFVQFHPSYSYSDFIEGIKPIQSTNGLIYGKIDGVFKEFCRKAANDLANKYFFVIDEINRADLSKVFGEIMYCLEEGYRGPKNKIATQYKNVPTCGLTGKDIFDDGFFIPENVVVLGTMNDIDRSVESIDFALRRRFKWINIKANDVMDIVLTAMWAQKGQTLYSDLISKIEAMNNYISDSSNGMGLDENYHIGPAYFKPSAIPDINNYLKEVWDTRLESLLREYVRGRNSQKINIFLDECQKKLGI